MALYPVGRLRLSLYNLHVLNKDVSMIQKKQCQIARYKFPINVRCMIHFSMLRHDNIVRLYGACLLRHELHMVMELIHGEDMAYQIAKGLQVC